jgi:hypothetical protein
MNCAQRFIESLFDLRLPRLTVLAFAILLLGIAVYAGKKDNLALYIGIAFVLFAFSYLTNLLDIAGSMTSLLIVIRTIA